MAFSDPQKILQRFAVRPGMRVADFGAGSGYYTLAAARMTLPGGHVYAVDLQNNLLDRIKNEANKQRLQNVKVVWGDIDEPNGSHLAPKSLDAVIIANVLFQVEHRGAVAEEAMRVLKPQGRVLVVDWMSSFGGLGPASGDVISQDEAEKIFTSAGFEKADDVTAVAGDNHYGLVFVKK